MPCVFILALALSPALAINTGHQFMEKLEVTANPIRKVVTMLQNMQKKVTEDGEKEKSMFDRFMCYCDKSDNTLSRSIASGENKVSELGTAIEAHTAEKAQLEGEVKAATAGRAEARATLRQADVLRQKESSAYAKESAMLKSNVEALGGAIAAISKGVSGAFLQTSTAATVRQIVLTGPPMSDVDRQDLMSFLSGGHESSYVPQSGQIIGILKNLQDSMDKSLADATASENEAMSSHDGLVGAKTKEIDALSAAVESKSKRVGDLAVTIAMEKNEHDDTSDAVSGDKKFVADLAKNCETKKAEWAEIVQTRSAELVALADTIRILNSDDSLELFKGTLPGSSFIQLQTTADTMRTRALEVIMQAHRSAKPVGLALDFVELALHGKKIGFGKVMKMIDNMVKQLNVEQTDDDDKKKYCEKSLDASGNKKKGLDQKIADLETALASAQEGVASTKAELEALADGVKALDQSVAEATEQRKEEHLAHTELMGNDAAAKELLAFAKNRLLKFYKPAQYKAPGSEALMQSAGVSSVAPPAAPEAPGPFKKKIDENNSVMEMLDTLVKDLDKEMQVAGVDEKNSQEEYEQTMRDSATKRAQDAKLITEKESIKAELESELQADKAGKLTTTKELLGTLEYISGLHQACDWLLQNHDVRKEARTSEIEALGRAKSILGGADFSLVQRKSLRAHQKLQL